MKVIMEGWRDFLSKGRSDPENEDKEKPPPSSVVTALMKRGGLSRDEAEKQAKKQVDLEEASRFITEQQVRDIFTEHGYILTEEMLQEIDWGKAKRLMNKGIVGLALIGALTGIARPVMANPAGGECSADECSVEIADIDEVAMKEDLAKLVEAIIGNKQPSPEELKEIYEMVGWNSEWGSHLDYLSDATPDASPQK